jgi:VIT1/CCC1 family predicted Fe2+/Mn2+ transporter
MTAGEIHGHYHRDVTGGWLRPAVFGASDGLVSNGALVAGVAGGVAAVNAGTSAIILAGLAGLAAGAFSMAVGEYVSVASQTELAQAEIHRERIELRRAPEAEAAEMAQVFVRRGVEPGLARQVVEQMSQDEELTLEMHVREELGLDPNDLPSPFLAAGSSFLAFSVGAILPVIPYLLGATSLWPSILVTAIALLIVGALVSRITVRPWWYSGLRQVILGGVAFGLTYIFGALVGGGVG